MTFLTSNQAIVTPRDIQLRNLLTPPEISDRVAAKPLEPRQEVILSLDLADLERGLERHCFTRWTLKRVWRCLMRGNQDT
jgi:hypothetical protein